MQGSLTLHKVELPFNAVELQHRVALPEGGVVVGLLWDVFADESGECIACIDDLMIPLPADMMPRLRRLLGKEIVLAKIEGYRVAPYRPRKVWRGWA